MSVYHALQSTRFLPSLASAAPFRLSRKFVKFSRLGQMWPLIQLPIFATILYFDQKYLPYLPSNMKDLLSVSNTWIQYFIALISIIKDAFWQKNIIHVVNSMDNYDKKTGRVNDGNQKRENERVRWWGFGYLAIIVILAIGRYCFWTILDLDIVMEIFAMQIDNAIYVFAILTILLGLRFRHLNSIIEKTRVTTVFEKSISESCDPANPEYIRVLYTSLVEIGEALNDHYSGRLFLWSAQIMFALVSRNYFLFSSKASGLLIVGTFLRLLPLLLGLLAFSVACQFTVEQANMFSSSLLEKSIQHTARIDRGRKEIFTMSLYIALQPFQFSALGFFSVDLGLTYAIATVTMTYLTLCMQSADDFF